MQSTGASRSTGIPDESTAHDRRVLHDGVVAHLDCCGWSTVKGSREKREGEKMEIARGEHWWGGEQVGRLSPVPFHAYGLGGKHTNRRIR
jgi:hypothetical protein